MTRATSRAGGLWVPFLVNPEHEELAEHFAMQRFFWEPTVEILRRKILRRIFSIKRDLVAMRRVVVPRRTSCPATDIYLSTVANRSSSSSSTFGAGSGCRRGYVDANHERTDPLHLQFGGF